MNRRITNAKKNTIDGILFLQGVYKKDCKKIEDFFTDKLLGDETKNYNKIPVNFNGLDLVFKAYLKFRIQLDLQEPLHLPFSIDDNTFIAPL